MGSFLLSFWVAINAELFQIAGRPISVVTLIVVVAIFGVTMLLSKLTRRFITKTFEMRGVHDEGTIGVITRLVHFVFLAVGFGVSVESIGIDLAALFAAGAVFAVALGFAVQNIVQNFVSGFILLAERVIKPGDVLELEGQLVKVRRMGIRSTVVRSLNDEDLIVPNATIVQSTVKNFTLTDSRFRLRTVVGVVYSSDMDRVVEILHAVAREQPYRIGEFDPVVLLTDFGDNSVNFEVSIWIDKPWDMRRRRSELNLAIWRAFKAEEIVIAFPQLDVHFDPGVTFRKAA